MPTLPVKSTKTTLRSLSLLLIAGMTLLTGCAPRDVGQVVGTPQAQRPPIPASVKILPTAATIDMEALILETASGTLR